MKKYFFLKLSFGLKYIIYQNFPFNENKVYDVIKIFVILMTGRNSLQKNNVIMVYFYLFFGIPRKCSKTFYMSRLILNCSDLLRETLFSKMTIIWKKIIDQNFPIIENKDNVIIKIHFVLMTDKNSLRRNKVMLVYFCYFVVIPSKCPKRNCQD